METIIVTGGAGFIGANFVRSALAGARYRVVVLDKLTYAASPLSLRGAEANPRYQFVHGDIADRAALDSLMEAVRPSAVVNFAAETHVDRSIDGPRNFVETNLMGCFELLEAARRFWSGLGRAARERFRFLQVSTDEVYGSLGESGSFNEESQYSPNSPYAASKAAADHFVRAYHATYGLPTLITNCSNNYGPLQFPEKLIPLTIFNAMAGRALPIYGDGRNVRDWLFVTDHCEALTAVLERGQPARKYNIGGRAERTNLEVVGEVCARLDALLPAAHNPALKAAGCERYSELIRFVPDRPGHDRRYAIDCSRIEGELEWRARVDFGEGIGRTVRWYLDNPEWCDSVRGGGYAGERLGLAAADQTT